MHSLGVLCCYFMTFYREVIEMIWRGDRNDIEIGLLSACVYSRNTCLFIKIRTLNFAADIPKGGACYRRDAKMVDKCLKNDDRHVLHEKESVLLVE